MTLRTCLQKRAGLNYCSSYAAPYKENPVRRYLLLHSVVCFCSPLIPTEMDARWT